MLYNSCTEDGWQPGTDVALFGCYWRVYEIIFWVLRRATANNSSSV